MTSFTRKGKHEFYTCSKQLASYLRTFSEKNNRYVPEFIKNLEPDQIRMFIHGVMMGDGFTRGGLTTLRMVSKPLMDEMVSLLIRAGYTISTGIQPMQTSIRTLNGKPVIGHHDLHLITFKKSNVYYVRPDDVTVFGYSGKVYCVSVPNKTLLIRRNGKITWCGNSWKSASAPYIYNPKECVLIACKNVWKKQKKGVSTIGRDEFMECVKGEWKYRAATSTKTEASFSLDIPLRAINILTYEGETVLDPFSGRGTTGSACKILGRDYIGIDISANYNEIARTEIDKIASRHDIDNLFEFMRAQEVYVTDEKRVRTLIEDHTDLISGIITTIQAIAKSFDMTDTELELHPYRDGYSGETEYILWMDVRTFKSYDDVIDTLDRIWEIRDNNNLIWDKRGGYLMVSTDFAPPKYKKQPTELQNS